MTGWFPSLDKPRIRPTRLPKAAPLTVAMHAVYDSALSADLTMVKTCASVLSATANTLTRLKAMQEIAELASGAGHIIPAEASVASATHLQDFPRR